MNLTNVNKIKNADIIAGIDKAIESGWQSVYFDKSKQPVTEKKISDAEYQNGEF